MAKSQSDIIPPTLHHYGLTVSDTEAMLDWYGKVLGTFPVYHRPNLRERRRLSAHAPIG